MKENVIQINGGITINLDVSAKNVMNVKKIFYSRIMKKQNLFLKILMKNI